MLFTGGSGNLLDQDVKEADTVRVLFESLGLTGERVVYETESRDTWENALFSMRLVRPSQGETWLLATSAAHMPRAVGVFRQAGWKVIPWPVDYETPPEGEEPVPPGFQPRLRKLCLATREWAGLVGYRLTERTDALFPAP